MEYASAAYAWFLDNAALVALVELAALVVSAPAAWLGWWIHRRRWNGVLGQYKEVLDQNKALDEKLTTAIGHLERLISDASPSHQEEAKGFLHSIFEGIDGFEDPDFYTPTEKEIEVGRRALEGDDD